MTPRTKKTLIWSIGSLLAAYLTIVLAGFAIFYAYPQLKNYEKQKKIENLLKRLEDEAKADTYGGKTPEETWGKFLGALEKGDVQLASKFISVGRQEDFLKRLINKNKTSLSAWVKDLNTLEKDTNNILNSSTEQFYNRKYFDHSLNRYLWGPVIFRFNQYSGVWKISDI